MPWFSWSITDISEQKLGFGPRARCCIPKGHIVDVVPERRRDLNLGLRLDSQGQLASTSNSFVEHKFY